MKYLRLLFLPLIPFLLAACASESDISSSSSVATTKASESFQPASGTAGLYIFKEGVTVSVVDSYLINLDGQMTGVVAWNSYLYLALSPGPHTLVSGPSQINLQVVAGRNYFVQQTPHIVGGEIVSSPLSLVAPQAGRQEILRMRQSRVY